MTETVNSSTNTPPPSVLEQTSSFLETIANFSHYALPIGAGIYTLLTGRFDRLIGLTVICLVQKVEIACLKYFTKKERPNHKDTESFPSGHVAFVALAGGFLTASIGTSAFLATGLITLIVAVNRVWNKHHYISDVVAGGLLGFTNGFLIGHLL